jgi:hypothetical protein
LTRHCEWLHNPLTRNSSADIDPASAAAGAVFLGLGLTFLLLIIALPLLWIVVSILLLVWVVKDAPTRGADGGIWLIVILLVGPIGFPVYLASRPAGLLIPCAHCGNQRLDYLKTCPICRYES